MMYSTKGRGLVLPVRSHPIQNFIQLQCVYRNSITKEIEKNGQWQNSFTKVEKKKNVSEEI